MGHGPTWLECFFLSLGLVLMCIMDEEYISSLEFLEVGSLAKGWNFTEKLFFDFGNKMKLKNEEGVKWIGFFFFW